MTKIATEGSELGERKLRDNVYFSHKNVMPGGAVERSMFNLSKALKFLQDQNIFLKNKIMNVF